MVSLLPLSFLGVIVAVAFVYVGPFLVEKGNDESAPPQGSGAFFDNVAPRYDILNRAISLGLDQSWRRAAAAAATSAQPEISEVRTSALDVASGTGDLALMLSSRFDSVHAIDPSHEMLARLRKKTGSAVHSVHGEAENLPFKTGQFDAVTVAFGVRNFADRKRGIREMARVLSVGGRLVVLEASVPMGHGPFQVAARFFIRKIMPAIGATVSGRFNDYKYLSTSMEAFPHPAEFVELLRQAGFDVESHQRLWPFGTGPDMYVAVRATVDS